MSKNTFPDQGQNLLYVYFYQPLRPEICKKYTNWDNLACLSLYIFKGNVFTFQFLNDKIHIASSNVRDQRQNLLYVYFHQPLRPELSAKWILSMLSAKLRQTKGQLISKANFKVFIWAKTPKKIFLYFCPSFFVQM